MVRLKGLTEEEKKAALKEYERKKYLINRDRKLARKKWRYYNDPEFREREKEYAKNYSRENAERVRELAKEWRHEQARLKEEAIADYYEKHQEELRMEKTKKDEAADARARERKRQYYRKHKEEIIAATKKRYTKIKTYGDRDPNLQLNGQSYHAVCDDIRARLLEEQDYQCAMCGKDLRGRKPQTVQLDHNHATSMPRAVLCNTCNNKVGVYEKNKGMIEAYLLKHDELEKSSLATPPSALPNAA